ncbi:NfeD family protein [Paenibacillus guangzhouensis]|uniref:NfeD family protein n=1 Tax=Paenibacillus guangzhouensis TaxID=1473112 RepID=UPI001266E362|nr:NfeD family protein [Paenibacillus guangzhouensis]
MRHFWKHFISYGLLMVISIAAISGAVLGGIPDKGHAAAAGKQLVYVIPVAHEIESGLQRFLERSFEKAEEAQASLIVLEVNTPGGVLGNAMEIGKLILESKIPTLAYIKGEAASAGSYISLCADQIVMADGSMIGAASIVDSLGRPVDNPKYTAAWSSVMVAAAQANKRNADIAAGMVDKDLVVDMKAISRVKKQGEIISLSAQDALAVGYADRIVKSMDEAVQFTGISDYQLVQVEQSWMEKLAGWLTSPVVSTLLLFLGIAGVTIELIVPGFGIPGIIGLLGFGLYFFGNYVAGFAEQESLVLFVLGIILLVLELFVPSFGILGILGSGSLIASVVMAAFDTSSALVSLGIAFVAAVIVVIIVARIFKHRGIWNRFILKDRLTAEEGYVSAESHLELLHQEGVSLTPLRPSGAVQIGEERIDVVTDGTFVDAHRKVVVTRIDGTRIIVREIEK